VGEVLTTIPVLSASDKGAHIPESWFRFGAYYVADDVILSVNNDPVAGGSETEYTVFKSIRILNQQGMRFATIPVPRYTANIALFSVGVLTADSTGVPVDEGDIRRKFEGSGKVVVPQAAPGSLVSVKIVFSGPKAPAVMEHWFLRPIPVETGRFVVHTDERIRFSYEYQTYGTRVALESAPVKQAGGTSTGWVVRNLEPLDSISFRRSVSEAEPRVSLRASPVYDENHEPITSWAMLTRWMGTWRIDPALFGSSGDVDEKTKEVVAGVNGDSARAEAIVTWLQKNILCQRQTVQATISDVLKKRRSDLFLVGLLCREMMKSCGIKAELVLTRDTDFGGFDSKFLSYYPCQDGMVIVHCGGVDKCVSPVYTGYPLGAYPAEYFGLSGLDIDEGKIAKLPAPLWKEGMEYSKATFDFSGDSALQTFHSEIGELSTVLMRRRLDGKSETEQREVIGKILRTRGESNAVVSFSVKNLKDLHAHLVVDARFHDNSEPEEIAGSMRHDLSQYFPRHFAGIDSTRREDISVTVPAHFIDTVEILRNPSIQVTLDASPWKAKNPLFDASVKILQTDASVVLVRDLDRHACLIPAANIAGIMQDIEGLDRAGKVAAVVTRRK
jgi:hypothetical protein